MNDIPTDWQCPACGSYNRSYRAFDTILMCTGVDCHLSQNDRYALSWEDLDSGFADLINRPLSLWLSRHRMVENDEYFRLYYGES